ncbi:NAD(P)H-dependent flavin oxidoreductase [Dysgonomonas capnocytophagoides]|nr:nitronate monooxygenase [Dysgonomonas capnocytophagoides]
MKKIGIVAGMLSFALFFYASNNKVSTTNSSKEEPTVAMDTTTNRISRILGIKYPIIQAPMMWITSAELVAAVSNAGGLGILGPNAGQKTSTNDPDEIAERLRNEIIKTRKLTDKPFGVNITISQKELSKSNRAILKVLSEEKVKILAVVGEVNVEQIKGFKNQGFIVIFREVSPSVAGAKAAEAAGADIIGATGFDAGGFTPKNPVGTMVIVPLIVDAVNVPVLASGGIVDKRTVNASFALGAEGVYLGTRFIASVESPVSNKTKENMVKFNTDDMLLYHTTYSFNRATPNKLAKELKEMDIAGATGVEIDKKMYGDGGLKTGMLEGNTDRGIDSYSSSIGLIKDIKTCEEIVKELMADIKL